MHSFSFIHCGDVHLGHNPFNEPQRMQDFARAFECVVRYALEHQVDFVLISGDFFHKRAINAQVLEQAVNLLEPLKRAKIPVVVIEGNHDKAFYQDKNSWLWFLNQQRYLYLLGPSFHEGKLVLEAWDEAQRAGAWLDLQGALKVRIYGMGYLGVTTMARLAEALPQIEGQEGLGQEGCYTILMLHAAVNRLLHNELGGVRQVCLDPFHEQVNYLALGHIHSRYQIDDWIYNPGSLECVHLDEYHTGEKGFYFVQVSEPVDDHMPKHVNGHAHHQMNYRVEVRPIATDPRPVHHIQVDLTDSCHQEAAFQQVMTAVRSAGPKEGSLIHISLKGITTYSPLSLDLQMMTETIKTQAKALYVEFENQLNLPVAVKLQEGAQIKREDIERLVFSQLLEQEGIGSAEPLEKAVQVVQKFKDIALTGGVGHEHELRELLLLHGDRILPEGSGEEGISA